tara:strand:+ start:2494 stop:2781 length:288 start_codon:yes stop_codon:yes gene_type:complete
MEYAIAIVVVLVVIFAVYLDRKDKGSKGSSTPVPTPRPSPASVVADKNENGITSKAELKTLTKVQLIDLADKNSLKIKKSGTKAQVINEIHSQLK